MFDIKVDQNLNISFPRGEERAEGQKRDMVFVTGIEAQKQLLFLFLITKKGDLWWNPTWGFDYDNLYKFLKLDNFNYIRNYFINVCKDLKLDVVNVKTTIKDSSLVIDFIFYNSQVLSWSFNDI